LRFLPREGPLPAKRALIRTRTVALNVTELSTWPTSVGAADAEQWHRPMADPRRRTNKIELTAGEGLPGANPKAEGAPAVGRTRNHPNLAKRGPYQILSWDL